MGGCDAEDGHDDESMPEAKVKSKKPAKRKAKAKAKVKAKSSQGGRKTNVEKYSKQYTTIQAFPVSRLNEQSSNSFLHSSTHLKSRMSNSIYLRRFTCHVISLSVFVPPGPSVFFTCLLFDPSTEAFHMFDWLNKLNPDCFGAVLQNRLDKPAILSYLFLTCGVCPAEKPPAFLV